MKINSKIDTDSIASGTRLTTFILTLPKYLLQEQNTHCSIAKNAASSRAVPIKRMIELCNFTPTFWGKAQPGMQAQESVDEVIEIEAKGCWESARVYALDYAKHLDRMGLHKQIVNRLIAEPFGYVTQAFTGTTKALHNYFALRCEAQAEPHLAYLATLMLKQWLEATPETKTDDQWHVPFLTNAERKVLNRWETLDGPTLEQLLIISVSRSARISYNRIADDEPFEKHYSRYKSLSDSGHWSCFQHQAVCFVDKKDYRPSQFEYPWNQYRKYVDANHSLQIDLDKRLQHMMKVCEDRGFEF